MIRPFSQGCLVPTVVLAAPLARWIAAGVHGERSFAVAGSTVREALDALLTQLPQLRGYVLDDQGALRHHVAAFVDGVVVRDKQNLSEPVPPGGEIYLVQALSGG
jgi:molybdopterin synthase sulfur carrier subunit